MRKTNIPCDYISPDAKECMETAVWEVIRENDGDIFDSLACTNHLHKYIGSYARVWPYEQ